MADAKRDHNQITTLLGVSNADGVTPVVLWADPVTHRLLVDLGGGSGIVETIVAGTGIDVDDTDPANPIVALDSATITSLGLADTAVQDLSDLGITASASELNILDGATLTVTELNFVDGVTSAIQTQLDGKQASITGTDTQVLFFDGINNPAGNAGLTYAKTTGTLILSNTETGAIGPVLELYQNSSSPASGDVVGEISFFGKDSAGNKQEYAQIQGSIFDPTTTEEDGRLQFGVVIAGTMTNKLVLDATTLTFRPSTNDGLALGEGTLAYSDLFLAEGGVINWDNGDATLTQSGNTVTLAGANLALGANSLTLTGSIGATGARSTKGWFTDLESTNVPTVGGSVIVDDTVYGSGWNGDTTHAPSRNAVYDKIETISAPTCTSIMPLPDYRSFAAATAIATGNTTASVGRFVLPFAITAAKMVVDITALSAAGDVKIGIFTEDGATQKRTFTAAVSGTGVQTFSFTGISLPAGIYYMVLVPVSTVNATFRSYTSSVSSNLVPAGGAQESGTLTVTADTMPATIDPTAITPASGKTIQFRLTV